MNMSGHITLMAVQISNSSTEAVSTDSDYRILEASSKGLYIQSYKNFKAVVVQWFQQHPREFFEEGM